ncbi:MAG: cytochrome c [Desulfobacteraceae bacterium]|nr:cytochrome c [Desulfobacteraceae bacterium]
MKKTILTGVFLALILTLFLQVVSVRDLVAQNGESIAMERCTGCHGIGRVERAGHDRERWERSIKRMMGKSGFGPKLSDAEQEALIEYLLSL